MSTALVLSGGGGRLAWQAGVLAELDAADVAFDHVFGTSGGALVGWFWCAGRMDRLIRLVTEEIRRFSDIYQGSKAGFISRLAWSQFFGGSAPLGVYSMAPLRRRLAREWDAHGGQGYRAAFYPVMVVANRGTVVFDAHTMESVLASTAIPGVVDPVENPDKPGEYWIDGGIREHTPLGLAVAHTDVDRIVVLTTETLTPSWPWRSIDDFFEYINRLFGTASTEIRLNDYWMTDRINRLVGQAEAEGVTLRTEAGRPYRHIELIPKEPSRLLASGLEIDHSTLNASFETGQVDGKDLMDEYDLAA